MNAFKCYSRAELREFLLGNLPEGTIERITSHLDECDVCEETVVGLDNAQDTLVKHLASETDAVAPESNLENDKFFNSALSRIVNDVDGLAQLSHLIATHPPTTHPQQIGDYEIIEPIARGGMASVFKASHMRLGKTVAIKILPDRKMRNPDSIARFAREMKIIGQLSHPSMVNATDAGDAEGIHYIVMEFVDGMDLGRIVRNCGPLRIPDACEIVRQAVIGLAYAHQENVIHRDVKPSNMMLGRDNTVKVLDLGLATLSGLNGTVDELTTVGQMMGTLDYMAPEQAGSDHPVDQRSDIYGLAATLYKLLTGAAPYSHPDYSTPLKKLKAMAVSDAIPVRDRNNQIPAELAELIDRCLHRDPAERIQTANELAELLVPFCAGHELGQLLERAETIRESRLEQAEKLGEEFNAVLAQPSQLPRQSPTQNRVAANPSTGMSWFGGFVRAAIALALFGGAIWGGIVIYLNTQSGQLIIESEIEDISVTVLRDEAPTRDLRIEHGAESTRLFAGKYRVEINGPSDGLVVTNDAFELRRGETVVTRITKKPLGENAVGADTSDNLVANVNSDNAAEALTTQKLKALSDLNTLRQTLGPDHPKVQELDQVIKMINLQLAALPSAHTQIAAYQIQNNPQLVFRILQTILADKNVMMQLDGPKKTLFVSATPSQQEMIKATIAKLDRIEQLENQMEISRSGKRSLVSYQLNGNEKVIFDILQTQLANAEGVQMEMDRATHRILVQAGPEWHKMIGSTIAILEKQLDTETHESIAEPVATSPDNKRATPMYQGKTLYDHVQDSLAAPKGGSKNSALKLLASRTAKKELDRVLELFLEQARQELSFSTQYRLLDSLSAICQDDEQVTSLLQRAADFTRETQAVSEGKKSGTLFSIFIREHSQLTQDFLLDLLDSSDPEVKLVAINAMASLTRNRYSFDPRWLPSLIKNLPFSSDLILPDAVQPLLEPTIQILQTTSFKDEPATAQFLIDVVESNADTKSRVEAATFLAYSNHKWPNKISELLKLIRANELGTYVLVSLIATDPDAGPGIRELLADNKWGNTKAQAKFRNSNGGGGSNLSSGGSGGSLLSGMAGGGSGSLLSGMAGGGGPSQEVNKHFNLLTNIIVASRDHSTKESMVALVPELEKLIEANNPVVVAKAWEAIEAITGRIAPPFFEGKQISDWLKSFTEADQVEQKLAAIYAIEYLAKKSEDRIEIAADIIVAARGLPFDDLTDSEACKVQLELRDLFVKLTDVRSGRTVKRVSLLTHTFIDALEKVDDQDAMFCLQVLNAVPTNFETKRNEAIFRFANRFHDAESELLRRRALDVMFKFHTQLAEKSQILSYEITNRALNDSRNPVPVKFAILDRFVYACSSGRHPLPFEMVEAEFIRGTNFAPSDDPRALATLIELAKRWSHYRFLLKPIGKVLNEQPKTLHEPVLPYNLDLWGEQDSEISQTAENNSTLFERIVDVLDATEFPPEHLQGFRYTSQLARDGDIWESTKKTAFDYLERQERETNDATLKRKLQRIIKVIAPVE